MGSILLKELFRPLLELSYPYIGALNADLPKKKIKNKKLYDSRPS